MTSFAVVDAILDGTFLRWLVVFSCCFGSFCLGSFYFAPVKRTTLRIDGLRGIFLHISFYSISMESEIKAAICSFSFRYYVIAENGNNDNALSDFKNTNST